MSPGPDVFFITQLESRKSILGKPHSGNIFPRVLERFNWSSEKENNSGVCVCVCVKWYKKRWSVHVCWMECNILTYNESVSCWVVSDFLRVYGLQPTRLLCPWDSPGKNTGVDCHFRFQGIFPIQRLNLISCSAGRFYTIWATRDVPYRKGVFLSAWYRVIGWFLGHALSLKVPGFWGEGTTTAKIILLF